VLLLPPVPLLRQGLQLLQVTSSSA